MAIYTRYSIIFSLLTLLVACTDNQSIIATTIGREIQHPTLTFSESSYTILRYIDNPSCTSCQLHAGQWKVLKRQLERKYNNQVRIAFLIETKFPDKAERITSMYKPAHIIHIDSTHHFIQDNNLDKRLGKDFVMLLDSDSHVIAVGNPCETKMAKKIYYQIIDSGVTYRNYNRLDSILQLDTEMGMRRKRN